MKINKKIFTVASSILLITGLAGCGTSETSVQEPKKVVSGSNGDAPSDKPAIVEGKLAVELAENIQNGKLVYKYSVKNDKEQDVTLNFSSSQEYEYQLKDTSGNVLYTFSMDKMFAQMQSEKTLKPGETLEFEIDISEDLKQLKPGTYQFEVWLAAEDQKDLKANAEFNWGGEGEGLEESPAKHMSETVTFVGSMDSNSIEVINSNGEFAHYRLSDKVKEQFESLESQVKINIIYSLAGEQRMVESFTIEE